VLAAAITVAGGFVSGAVSVGIAQATNSIVAITQASISNADDRLASSGAVTSVIVTDAGG